MLDKTRQAAENLFTLMERAPAHNAFTDALKNATWWSSITEDTDEFDELTEPGELVGLIDWYGHWVPFDYE